MSKVLYSYTGPVLINGVKREDKWSSKTVASSEKQAINNLKYQYANGHGINIKKSYIFPGKLKYEYEIP